MQKPALVVMAAGMGSRYGGLKQIDPVGPNGEIMMDYSIYDALRAGFGKIVFIIKEEIQEEFRQAIGKRIEKLVDTDYVFQKLEDVPKGFAIPIDRKKPWGTAHAIMSCRHTVHSPFAVINADDFYGSGSFQMLYNYLSNIKEQNDQYHYCMAGFILQNTLTDHGHVARGICHVDQNNHLIEIHERTRIEKRNGEVQYTEDGDNWVSIPKNSIVSMNLWGFTTSILEELEIQFPEFLKANEHQLLKAEYLLPEVVGNMIKDNKASVKVLPSQEHWYGVTYKEDKQFVNQAISKLVQAGVYNDILWND